MKLSRCLSDLGISDAVYFEGCDDIGEEFKAIKKSYIQKVLKEHPDKGGDVEVFRRTQAAWEVLRGKFDKNDVKNGSFASYLNTSVAAAADDDAHIDEEDEDDFDDDLYTKYGNNANVPSYDYFAAAAEEEVPGYRVELAKSGRSKCTRCSAKIAKDAVRVGSLDKMAGGYGRWNHLECWRVPNKVQNGFTDPSDEQVSLRDILSMEDILLTGTAALDDAEKILFVQHCVNSENWAGYKKRKAKQIMGESNSAEQGVSVKGAKIPNKSESASAAAKGNIQPSMVASSNQAPVARSNNIVPENFAVLVPGVDGALNDDKFLRGKTFLISGAFPEVGGSNADSVGMENIKAMIGNFGGKVITRFSKNTNFLLVGKDPVTSKFKDAIKRSMDIINLKRLQGLLLGHISFMTLKSLPALTSDAFIGDAYQPAGPPPPAPQEQESAQPILSTSSAKQPVKAEKVIVKAEKVPKAKKPTAKGKKPTPNAEVAVASASSQALVARAASVKENAIAGKKVKFQIPRPGVNGAIAGVLDDKRFVLTGVYPELGGGAGLTLGKERVKALISDFGGKVTSAVSGKTDFVLVGKNPGRSKVTQADKRGLPLLDLVSLQRLLMGQSTLEAAANAPPPCITNFSAGYSGALHIGY